MAEGPATRIVRVGVVAKQGLTAAAAHLSAVADWLHERGVETVFEVETAELAGLDHEPTLPRDAIAAAVDLVLVLGGDGTLLGTASRIGAAGLSTPILGVNFGRLGFLTEVTLEELFPALESVLDGTAHIHERRRLHASVQDGATTEAVALNDVVVTRGEISRVIDLAVTVDGQFVTRVKGDGVIVATPTGSTAYNLAASGPIVHPDVDAILITPIAPHTLANRPIVIPGSSTVEVAAIDTGRPADVFVTFDGQRGSRLSPTGIVRITRAPRPVRLVSSATRGYYDTLREKLGWGEK
ncbi:MAG TPA: NAD(+)/NADH kinase [Vicinamibacterales bacterium]